MGAVHNMVGEGQGNVGEGVVLVMSKGRAGGFTGDMDRLNTAPVSFEGAEALCGWW